MNQMPTINNRHGFTLIELMVVVAILGIIAAIAVVSYMGYLANSKQKTCMLNTAIASRFISSEIRKKPDDRVNDVISELNRGGKMDPYNASHDAFGNNGGIVLQNNCQIGISTSDIKTIPDGTVIVITGVENGNATLAQPVAIQFNVTVE